MQILPPGINPFLDVEKIMRRQIGDLDQLIAIPEKLKNKRRQCTAILLKKRVRKFDCFVQNIDHCLLLFLCPQDCFQNICRLCFFGALLSSFIQNCNNIRVIYDPPMVLYQFYCASIHYIFHQSSQLILRRFQNCLLFEFFNLKLALDILLSFEMTLIFSFGLGLCLHEFLVILVLFLQLMSSSQSCIVHHVDLGMNDQNIY